MPTRSSQRKKPMPTSRNHRHLRSFRLRLFVGRRRCRLRLRSQPSIGLRRWKFIARRWRRRDSSNRLRLGCSQLHVRIGWLGKFGGRKGERRHRVLLAIGWSQLLRLVVLHCLATIHSNHSDYSQDKDPSLMLKPIKSQVQTEAQEDTNFQRRTCQQASFCPQ